MSEPTTYALPAEPEGPVWDSHGRRWTPTALDGWWLRDVTGVQCTWARLLEGYGPLTTTPPWKPEVGGVCKTEDQYAALPEGSIVARANVGPFIKLDAGLWHGESGPWTDVNMAALTSSVLRVGWES